MKIIFPHGDLKKEIYMEQPEGFQVEGKKNLMCRLKKGLYGLNRHLDSGTASLSPLLWTMGTRRRHQILASSFRNSSMITSLSYCSMLIIC